MTNDKQRLVELLEEANREAWNLINMNCCEEKLKLLDKVNELRADYLLANGVIVPPYQIGETVYVIIENMLFVYAGVYECEVEWYSFGKDGLRPTVKVKSDNIIDGINCKYILKTYTLQEKKQNRHGTVSKMETVATAV